MTSLGRKGRRELTLLDLQNLINRDSDGPELYRQEFEQRLRFFNEMLSVFDLSPGQFNENLSAHLHFLSHVAKNYPKELKEFPQTLVSLLKRHATVLDSEMRMEVCKALILMRRKNLLRPADLLTLFFDLFKCQDKVLRKYLRDHIVYDIKTTNSKGKDVRLNTTLQNFMFKMLEDSHKTAAKTSLEVMIELYQKGVWRDGKTVNVISTACFSPVTKLAVTALKFFLGKDSEGGKDGGGDDSDSDDEDNTPALKNVVMANRFNKQTRKRERYLTNVRKAHRKKDKKDKAENYNFSALHLIHDPQGFAEKLFKRLDGFKDRFEVKILYIDLISRLIGTHELLILSFYQYLARFLNPHQREVVAMLQYVAQASHELVPPESVEPALKAIVNNFVTERNSGEVMAIGLNAVREICKRCPLVMDETLLRDLAGYKLYKDKAVMMAARSLILLFRATHPDLLHKKDRGRPTEAQIESAGNKKFGEVNAKDFIPGAEELNSDENDEGADDDSGDDSDGWENVEHDPDVEEGEEDEEEEEEGKEGGAKEGKKFLTIEEKREKAKEVATTRILSDADFKKIDAAQLKKQLHGLRKGSGKKRKAAEMSTEDAETTGNAREELVDLANIEMVHKKRKHDKESRLATVLEGRKDRDKFGSRKGKADEHASTTNKMKNKKKNFMMLKHKIKKKSKRSFQEKAQQLKRSLMRRQKFS